MAETGLTSELREIDERIEKLKGKRKELEKKAGERIARLAREAGLLELALKDDDLRDGFKDLAARFRGTARTQPVSPSKSKPAVAQA